MCFIPTFSLILPVLFHCLVISNSYPLILYALSIISSSHPSHHLIRRFSLPTLSPASTFSSSASFPNLTVSLLVLRTRTRFTDLFLLAYRYLLPVYFHYFLFTFTFTLFTSYLCFKLSVKRC